MASTRDVLLMLYARHEITESADEDCEECGRSLTIAEVLADQCRQCHRRPSESEQEVPF